MIKHYLKQAWQLMKDNPFYTFVYILGTSLSISIVMIMAIVYHIKTADIPPEVNRSRSLYINGATAIGKEGGRINALLSYQSAREILYNLEIPSFVALYVSPENVQRQLGILNIHLPGSDEVVDATMRMTDSYFWQLNHFQFLWGKPYSEEEFLSGIKKAVLSEDLVNQLFGKVGEEVIGQSFQINDIEYYVTGVIRDISPAMENAYANVWIPFTSMDKIRNFSHDEENITGIMKSIIVAESTNDYAAIRKEIELNRMKYNTSLIKYELDEIETFSRKEVFLTSLDWSKTNSEIIRYYLLILLLFLVVPSLNLSGLISSGMQDRMAEFGVRKTFGAGTGTLIKQVLTENMFFTLFGGLIGLVISYIIIYFFRDLFLDINKDYIGLSPGMLINYSVFLYALFFCVFLNLLSSVIPVWVTTRRSIISTMNAK